MLHYFILFLSIINSSVCVNILIVSPIPSPSHYLWHKTLATALIEKGYNITMFSPYKHSGSILTNYSEIYLEDIYKGVQDNFDPNNWINMNPFEQIINFENLMIQICSQYYNTKGFQELISYPKDFKYDIILVDVSGGPCILPVVELLNKLSITPVIATSPFLLPLFVSYMFGNHLHPSYISWYGLPYTNHMSFVERVWNFLFTYFDIIIKYGYAFGIEEKSINHRLRDNIPPFNELEKHVGLILANIDPILDYPQPLTPNIIPVGGLQIRPPRKLPQDLQVLLDNAKNGFILFSLGTNIRSDKIDKITTKALIDAFSKLPFLILWKFESEIENLPKNIIVRKWLPQNDILGHANIKLFISHGGALSSQEAIYHGVPLVVIPFLLDQHLNSKMVTHKEIGLEVNFHSITTEYITTKLQEVIRNPKYSQNIKKLSRRYRDQPQTPMERALFWIQYVMRHGDVDFLSTPARNMPFYVSSSLDIILVLVLSIVFVLFLIFKFVKAIFNSFRRKIKKE